MKFISRSEWGARPPSAGYTNINSTVTTGHWEGPSLWGGSIGPHSSCAPKVRSIQDYHMNSNGWSDIAYNGVACPHGYVFEGRGPGHRSAANGTNAGNDTSAVICYLGGEGDPFTAEGQAAMLDGAFWLGDPMLKGHRDWYNTACPGDDIYGWIQAGCPTDGYTPSPGPGPGPSPTPEPEDDDVVLTIAIADDQSDRGRWYVTDLLTCKTYLPSKETCDQIVWCVTAGGGKIYTNNGGPVPINGAFLNSLPTTA